MTYILMIWTIVAAGGGGNMNWSHSDWRPMGEFKTAAACQHAAEVLGVQNRARCVPVDTVKVGR